MSALLTAVRHRLVADGRAHILKFALVTPSTDAGYDVDYRFAQCLPSTPDRFDLRVGCGHSMLASVAALGRHGHVSIRILNTGGRAVCHADRTGRLAARFVHDPPLPTQELLITGRPVDLLLAEGHLSEASLVTLGNPYVFVDAARLGITTPQALFTADHRLLRRMERLRRAAGRLLGLPPEGALPKIAAIGAFQPGRLTVRAVTVPGWHPGIALTGAACLAAACAVEGTVPQSLARSVGCPPGVLRLDTSGGPVFATADTGTIEGGGQALFGAGVSHKRTVVESSANFTPAHWRTYATA